MNPSQRWEEVDALLAEVMARPREERESWLEFTTSGDPELRAEVLALLASIDEAPRRIGEAALELLPALDNTDLSITAQAARVFESLDRPLEPGTRLGAYEIVREIGRGGMGAVYLARRADAAFERAVAVKLVRDARDTLQWRQRFRAEQRILAALEHPNIARLYDTGIAEGERPYLVMEYVEGTRLDQAADEKRLDLTARLQLMITVCDAVSFAHQRLVVHRDLKPANVLVDASGTPKLVDFGIATLMEGDGVTGDEGTGSQRLLTPEYASPELMRGELVGAAADVYALGIMLHELLVGFRPAWQQLVRTRAAVADLEREMVPPSRAFMAHGLEEERQQTASLRGLSPRELHRRMKGDLDAVVLKTLDPDPARRYASVEQLRADLQRIVDQRPVLARPATFAHRARCFVRRNRLSVSLAAVVLLLAAASATSFAIQSRRIVEQRDTAERERTRARQVAALLTSLFEGADPFGTVDPDTIRVGQLVDAAATRIEQQLPAQSSILAEMQTVLGGIYQNLNRGGDARELLERAVTIRRTNPSTTPFELATSTSKLGEAYRAAARYTEAESLFTTALHAFRQAGSKGSDRVAGALADLGRVMNETDRFDSARVLYDSALSVMRAAAAPDTQLLVRILNDRGWLASREGDIQTSLQLAEQALDLQRAFEGNDHPTTLIIMGNLAYLRDQVGKSSEAVPLHREAVAGLRKRLGNNHSMVGIALSNLAGSLGNTGSYAEAVAAAEEGVEVTRRSSGDGHLDVAMALNYLASAYDDAGRHADALEALEESYRLHVRTLGTENPGTAIMLVRLGGARCRDNATTASRQQALVDLERALRVIDNMFDEQHPQRISRHVTYALCLARNGRVDDAAREAAAQADVAIRNHPPTAPVVAIALRGWRSALNLRNDTVGLARVSHIADSLGVALSR